MTVLPDSYGFRHRDGRSFWGEVSTTILWQVTSMYGDVARKLPLTLFSVSALK